MKLIYHSYVNQRSGFLLIELLLALGLLGGVGLVLGLYQTKVRLYRQAAAQLYQAMNIASNCLEQLQVGLLPAKSSFWKDHVYQINLQVSPNLAWKQLIITVSWQNAFYQKQKISWEGICLNLAQA